MFERLRRASCHCESMCTRTSGRKASPHPYLVARLSDRKPKQFQPPPPVSLFTLNQLQYLFTIAICFTGFLLFFCSPFLFSRPEHREQLTFGYDTAEHDFRTSTHACACILCHRVYLYGSCERDKLLKPLLTCMLYCLDFLHAMRPSGTILVDIFKCSELGAQLGASIAAHTTRAAAAAGARAGATACDNHDGTAGTASGSGASRDGMPREPDGMALALQNIHRVIRQEDGEGDESVVVAPTADSGLPLLLPPPTTPSTRADAGKRNTEGIGSRHSSSLGSGGDGGNQGLLLNKKKRFIPEPARKNGPNSKRRKKSNASPFHAVRQQREATTATESERARMCVRACVRVRACMCARVCVCGRAGSREGRRAMRCRFPAESGARV